MNRSFLLIILVTLGQIGSKLTWKQRVRFPTQFLFHPIAVQIPTPFAKSDTQNAVQFLSTPANGSTPLYAISILETKVERRRKRRE